MPNAKEVNAVSQDIPLKVLIVGDYGTGKSTFASSFPTPAYLFDFDDRVRSYAGFDFEYETYGKEWKEWLKFEKTLAGVTKDVAAGKYKTVVIDSTTSMTDLAMERAMSLDPKRSPTGGPIWNIHFMLVRNLMEGRIRQLTNLGCNVVVIAHMELKTDEETGSIISAQPLLTGQLSIKVPGYFDEVYYATTRRKGQETKWVVQTVPIGIYKARSTLSGRKHLLPDYVDNDYNSIIKHLTPKEKKNV